jgi:IclR helix-turn-helix domain
VLKVSTNNPSGERKLGITEQALMVSRDDCPVQDTLNTGADAWGDVGSDFVLIPDRLPPSRIELARERLLLCRLYLGLIRSIGDDYGAEFAAHSDSSSLRTIGIYVFLRTVMCSPVHAARIARALKLPRSLVLRRLQEMVKRGYVERIGNAYRVTDKVNIPGLQLKLQRRIDMIVETARKLTELSTSTRPAGAAQSTARQQSTGPARGPAVEAENEDSTGRQRSVQMPSRQLAQAVAGNPCPNLPITLGKLPGQRVVSSHLSRATSERKS